MANQEHLEILRQGTDAWNVWRVEHPETIPDLTEIDLTGVNLFNADLHEADLSKATIYGNNLGNANLEKAILYKTYLAGTYLVGANLAGANLTEAYLYKTTLTYANLEKANLTNANLTLAGLAGARLTEATLIKAGFVQASLNGANLSGATLTEARLSWANLVGADLTKTYLVGADLTETNLTRANLTDTNLTRANLAGAILVSTNLTRAIINDCLIYGISAWDVQIEETKQLNLVITPPNQPTITVDNLKIAQFIYLLLNNTEIRDVIDTITSKVVLILGRFTEERKKVLDVLRDELRKWNYSPVLFDFDKPASRDITETISALAHLARFIIADITDAKSIPQELLTIVPNLPSVPVQPLLLSSQREYGMYEHFTRFPWVLPIYHYTNEASLLKSLNEGILEPAEQKAKELSQR